MAEWEKIAEQSRLTRSYNKLDNIRSYYFLPLADMVDEYIDEMYSIYNKKLFHYETTDDHYRGRLEDVYDKYTSLKERISDFMDKALSVTWEFVKSAIIPAILVAICYAFPPTGVVIAGFSAAGCGALAGVKYGKAHRINKTGKPDVDDLISPKDVDDVKPDVKKKDADVGKVNEGGTTSV